MLIGQLTLSVGKKEHVWVLQLVAKWRKLAEESRWDEFVAAMLQEHYDAVYSRAQIKYLTPSATQDSADQATNTSAAAEDTSSNAVSSSSSPYEPATDEHPLNIAQNGSSASQTPPASAPDAVNGKDEEAQGSSGDATVQAAGALSHLFGGPRQKLMQQMNNKEAESTLRWHREPVEDMRDETYDALAQKLLKQYDPAALA